MDGDKLNKWLTLGANVGVLAGLLLVAYEINQSAVLVRADLASQQFDRFIAIDIAKQDESLASALEKANESPEELTTKEMVQLENSLYMFTDTIVADWYLYDLGVFKDDPSVAVQGNIRYFFGNRFAQLWWSERRNEFPSRMAQAIDEAIQSIDPGQDLEVYNRIRSKLAE